MRVFALLWEHVRWQFGKQIQHADHSAGVLSQYDFVAAPENLNFRAFDAKLFWQPHSLAVPGLKYASEGHDLPPGYIYSNVYTFASANSEALGEQRREGAQRAQRRALFVSLMVSVKFVQLY